MAMRVGVCPDSSKRAKFRGLVQLTSAIWSGSVLDVGSRSGELRDELPGAATYLCGLDQHPTANVVGDLEKGLPFRDRACDIVVALDILEHTNDIHRSFAELCRVSRRHVVITLPNLYSLKHRLKMMRGRPLSGKYGLPSDPPPDRHRWFFTFDQAIGFTRDQAARADFGMTFEGCLVGARGGYGPLRIVAGYLPSLMSAWYVAVLSRRT